MLISITLSDNLGKETSLLCSSMASPIRLLPFLIFLLPCLSSASNYLVGLGTYDITGPAADVNMMGYANTEQVTSGVHFRLRARSFIVADPNGKQRIAYVNLDACMASQIVTIKVLERLKARYGDLYTDKNVAISGIHTHAGPGGYLQYVIYIVTSLGFVRQSFDAVVDGIEQSIVLAHQNLRPGSISINTGELLDAGVNRSPSSYLNNPASERAKYKYNVDKEMTLIKFVDDQFGPIGTFNWFATHGTSMSRTNSLISGDNKGAAARFMEDWFEKRTTSAKELTELTTTELLEIASSFKSSKGQNSTVDSSVSKRASGGRKPQFVSAFCQTNCGDVSPNVLGAFCTDTGLPCDFNHSTCNGKNQLCNGRGPGYPDEFESTRVIGDRQFRKAVELFNGAKEQLKGKIDYRHEYVDFSNLEVATSNDEVVKTCPAAMGFAFAAGTTDGPGAFDFKQGDDKGNTFWRLVRGFLKTPGPEQVECQKPKPILLDTGEMKLPYDWAGASTLYGPNTLSAYIQEFKKLATAMVRGQPVESGPQPPDLLDKQISLLTPVVVDSAPLGKDFGDMKTDVQENAAFRKGEMVSVTFHSACPRNDLKTEGTFALVEYLQKKSSTWVPVYDDDDFCLRFKWSRPAKLSAESYATIEWRIPESAGSGVYRISHFGAAKSLLGSISHFSGSSSAFVVL
ncbi:Neutral ceramidase 3 [Linum perenne]